MNSTVDAKMHLLTLEFPTELEGEFLDDYYHKSLKQVRVATILGFSLYAIWGIADMWIVPEARPQVWFIRYAVVCPITLLVYLFTFSQAFKRFMQPAISIGTTIAGIGIIVMTVFIQYPGKYLYYGGLGQVLMYAYTFTRLRFIYASILSWVISAIYIIVAIWIGNLDFPVLLSHASFLIIINVLGMFASYFMEFYTRRNFLQNRIIAARAQELQEKNNELIQSREEILRSAKRTELIFSALSDALPGTVLDDKYQLEEKIGSGGFGTVYRATHLLLQHSVAVKVFRPSFGTDPIKNLERFRVERVSASRVRHPNAVSVLDFGVSASSIAYMVMELLQGWSLKDELDEKETLSVARCIDILIPVCRALAEAHAAGIIHRDIKPSNIFLHQSEEGEIVKVVDFGIAKLVSDTLNPELLSLTETGSLLGTPVYMSPERLSNKPYDGQADIYSLGVMMYEILCGRLPFQSSQENYWSIVLMHLTHTATSPRSINPEIPEKLEAVMMKALAKDPLQRPSPKELEEQIKEFASREGERSSARSSRLFRKPRQPNTTIRHTSRIETQQVDQHTIQETSLDETVLIENNVQAKDNQNQKGSNKDTKITTPPKMA